MVRQTTVRRVAVAGVAAAQAFLSLWRLGVSSWHTDELIYARAGRAYLQGDLTANLEHPPLAKYLIGLPQAILWDSTSTARLLAVVAGAAVGVCLFLLVRSALGFWTGLAVWGAWVLLPRSVGLMETETHLDMVRLERFALLDVFAAGFMAVGLLLGWWWVRQGRWPWAVAAGVAIGLATASKAVGITAALVVVGAALAARPAWATARQAMALGAAAAAAVAIAYLPFGTTAPDALRFMVDHQTEHAEAGHLVYAGGSVHTKPPWWVFLAYQVEADGWILTAAIAVAIAAALVLARHHRVTWYLLAAMVVPLVVLTISPVVIRHYRYVALPGQVALVAIGVVALARRPGWTRAVAAVVAAPLLLAAARDVGRVATLSERDYAELAAVLEEAEPQPVVVLRGVSHVAAEYTPGATFVGDLPAGDDVADVAAVVLDPPAMLLRPDPDLEEAARELGFVETHMGRLRVFLDPDVAAANGIEPSG